MRINTADWTTWQKVAFGDFLPLSGGTMTGTIITSSDSNIVAFRPDVNNNHYLGSNAYKWKGVYATTFYGNLSGTATTATKAKYLTNYSTAYSNPGYGGYSLSYYTANTTVTSSSTDGIANPTSTTDSGDWYYHMLMIHGDPSGYFCDVAWRLNDISDPSMYFRMRTTSAYSDWVKVVTSENLPNYLSTYYWANLPIQTIPNSTTSPSFRSINVYEVIKAGTYELSYHDYVVICSNGVININKYYKWYKCIPQIVHVHSPFDNLDVKMLLPPSAPYGTSIKIYMTTEVGVADDRIIFKGFN
jgi:hypothetical protein